MSKNMIARMAVIRDEILASGVNPFPDQMVEACRNQFQEYARIPGNMLKKAAVTVLKDMTPIPETVPVTTPAPTAAIDVESESATKRSRESDEKEQSKKPKTEESSKRRVRRRTHFILNDDSDREQEVDGSSPDSATRSKGMRFEPAPLPDETLETVAGFSALTPQIHDLIIRPLRHPEVPRHLGVGSMTHVLLHGPPGSGKTFLAHAIAGSAGVQWFKVNATEVVSGVSGESEAHLRQLFAEAKRCAPSLVFIDEVDAITPRRDQAAREMERRIVSQLFACLDDLQGSNVVVLGATSRPDAIDPALRRAGRFDRELAVGIPDERTRQAVIDRLLMKVRVRRCDVTEEQIEEEKRQHAAKIRAQALPHLTSANLHDSAVDLTMEGESAPADESMPVGEEGEKEAIAALEAQLVATLAPAPVTSKAGIQPRAFPVACDDKTIGVEAFDLAARTPGYVFADLGALVKEAALLCVSRTFEALKTQEGEDSCYSESDLEKVAIEKKDVDAALERVQPSARREGFATIPDVTWDDVGALQEVRRELERLILQLQHPELCKALNFRPSPGALLYGPPGTGKTLVAKAAARMSGANFISVKGPELLNKFVGESERGVRDVFQRARDSKPCVVFFDELDALCPQRGQAGGSQSSERVVNQLLTELDGVGSREGVLVLGATNRPDMVDQAMLRPGRLDSLLLVPLADGKGRVDILKTLTRKSPLADDVDLAAFADRTEGYSGADLAAVVREASMASLETALQGVIGRKLKPEEVEEIVKQVKVGKIHLEGAMRKVGPSVSAETQKFYEAYAKDRESKKGK